MRLPFPRGTSRRRTTDQQRALDAVFLPVAVGQVLAAAETLTLRDTFDDDGYLRGISARDHRPGSLRHRLHSVLDHPRSPKILAGLTLVASAAVIARRGDRRTQIVGSAVIGACNRLNEIRTPYGRDGADQMAAVVTQYRTVTALLPDRTRSDDVFLRAVNFQAALSYAVSGLSKATGSAWVQGDALYDVLQSESYGNGPAARLLKSNPQLCRLLTVSTVAWECAFPLLYVLPLRRARHGLLAVKGFHVGVATVMELPRFVWGFTGSHGAVDYVLRNGGSASSLEKRVMFGAGAVVAGSAILAREKRRAVVMRQQGLKGSRRLPVEDGEIEYMVDGPGGEGGSTVLLECGLGQSMDSWSWVAGMLAQHHTVVRYHRRGYGLTTSDLDPFEAVDRLLDAVGAPGPVVVLTHSIGSLHAATYVSGAKLAERVSHLVVIDGTDPDLLEADRTDRRRLGKFLQIQFHTLFASLTGTYQWAPNPVERQASYEPDDQLAHVQFAFAPRNVVNAVREYLRVDTERALSNAATVPAKALIASQENAQQQATLARKLEAELSVVEGSAHRSILGRRHHATEVVEHVRRFVGEQ